MLACDLVFAWRERVAWAQRLERLRQLGPVGILAAGLFFVDDPAARLGQGVALEVEVLIIRQYAGIADAFLLWAPWGLPDIECRMRFLDR